MYNGCHDLTKLSVNISDIIIITVKDVHCRCIIHDINKSGAINLSKSSVLDDRRYILKNIALIFSFLKAVFLLLFFFLLYIK